jgi:hypothetical protein
MTRLTLLLFCLCVGCVRVPPAPPKPDDVTPAAGLIGEMSRQYDANFRESCLIAAGKLRSGAWKTDREYLEGHKALRKIAVEHAGQAFADRQQAEATPFTPEKMADWLERVAKEGQP